MDQQSHVIPFDLESPVPIMFWEPLEFVLAISLMGFGSVANVWLIGVTGGVAVLMGARYLKRGAKRGAMQHLMWAYGLQLDSALTKKFKPSWLNDFIQ